MPSNIVEACSFYHIFSYITHYIHIVRLFSGLLDRCNNITLSSSQSVFKYINNTVSIWTDHDVNMSMCELHEMLYQAGSAVCNTKFKN